jgi:hypothetical protein
MPWGIPVLDGFFIEMVTVPAFAVSVVVSNMSNPLGSATRFTVVPDAAAAAVVVAAAAVVVAAVVVS